MSQISRGWAMDGTEPLRTVFAFLAVCLAPACAAAQSLVPPIDTGAEALGYELGGAAMLAARAPEAAIQVRPQVNVLSPRYPDRVPTALLGAPISTTTFGDISVFGGEDKEDGQNVLRLGTALTRGRTTTGLSITYRDELTPSRSEVFVDYALSDTVRVGLSGIFTEDAEAPDDPVARLGLSAAIALDTGAFIQGGIADAPDEQPVFGLALGLKF